MNLEFSPGVMLFLQPWYIPEMTPTTTLVPNNSYALRATNGILYLKEVNVDANSVSVVPERVQR